MTALTRMYSRPASFPRFARCRRTLPNIRWNSSTVLHHASPQPTKVEKLVLDYIKTTGPLSFATYMQLCLSHPTDGYYMNPANKVFGAAGDFITSPEISQTFGELIAVWLLQEYMKSEITAPLRLVELGPGKGTLMADILRVIQGFKPQPKLNVHLVETSRAMRDQQQTHLSSPGNENVQLNWHNSIDEIRPSSSEYTMLVAHEFFDALPIHILHKSKETGLWHEVLIASNDEINPKSNETATQPKPESTNTSDPIPETQPHPPSPAPATETKTPPKSKHPRLRRVLSAKPSNVGAVLGLSSARFADIEPGSYLEVSPTSFRIARKIGELLSDAPASVSGAKVTEGGEESSLGNGIGGCGLIIDYGGPKAYSDSLRAFKNHEIVDVLQEPGNCDITANVDFAYLREAMSDLARPLGPISQGTFLTRMGLSLRLRTLLGSAKSEERKEAMHSAAMRLIDPKGMGEEYRVLGITTQSSKPKSESGVHDENGGKPWPFYEAADGEVDR